MNKCYQFAFSLCALLVLAAASGAAISGQVADRLSEVKKLYLGSLGHDKGAAEMREQLVRKLRKTRAVEIVSDPKNADAVVRGTGRIWVTGHFSLSPRSHSLDGSTFSGFLSAEVVGRNDETLWSYLVTPSKFLWKDLPDDLAGQLVSKLLVALKGNAHQEPGFAGSVAQPEGMLTGAGSTFSAPLYLRWFESFQELYPEVHFTYDGVGSAEGIERLKEGRVDFGASDMPLSDRAMSEAYQHVVQVPTVLGAVVVVYNVKGLRQTLNFTPDILSGIYLGTVNKWNDPQIKKSNPGATLPDSPITVVHRSDGSGTTFVWTDYLSKISPDWRTSVGVGTSVPWPVGIGAEHNEGVASAVQRTANSIGYVEFIYAVQHELSFGAVRNSSGEFIKASISSVTAAATRTTVTPDQDLRVSITNPPFKAAYPIATYTWLLIPDLKEDKNKNVALTQFVRWALTSGQKKCSALGYVPLPEDIAHLALKYFDSKK